MSMAPLHFPPPINKLLCMLSKVGFFDHSLLIGSWAMPLYQERYGIRYVLRTLDIDFAVHLVRPPPPMRADVEQQLVALNFVPFFDSEGVQKFTAGGYEVEFIAPRPGGRSIRSLAVREWNLNALPLPHLDPLIKFSETIHVDEFIVRFPVPEAFFVQKLIVAPKRKSAEKRLKDLEQCTALTSVLDDHRLCQIVQSQRFSKETRRRIAQSCATIEFPVARLGLAGS